MKFLKVLLVIVLILAGLILVVPLFLPSTVTVSVESEVGVSPMQVFKNASVFDNRDKWDPWLKMDPEAKVTITPKENIIGSTYEWEGEKIGSGKMQVDSIVPGKYIASSIWFAGSDEASLVEWFIEKSGEGSKVTWTFTSEGAYPIGRIILVFMKGGLKSSFESGIVDFKAYLEANPPKMYKLSEIKIDEMGATNSMVIPAEGTMQEIAAQMAQLYPALFQEIGKQQLQMAGPAFAYYLDFDEETGISHVLLGAPVASKGKTAGAVKPRFFPAMKAVLAVHYGEYNYFQDSYATMMEYIEENEIEVSGEAFEVYLKSMMHSEDPMEWETLIGFPLK